MANKTANKTAAAKTAAAVKNTNNNAANVAKTDNAAAVVERPKMSPTDVAAAAVELIKQHGTIANIRKEYAANVDKYGKDNFAAVLKAAQELRAREISAASDALNSAVFTYTGISAAVFAAVARERAYADLCAFARREYNGTDAQRAAAVVRDYFTAVDANGAPLCKVNYINAAGSEIYTAYAVKTLTHTNAVAILKTALDNMAKTATNAATKKDGNDNAAAVRANVHAVGIVCAVYAAALDENERATRGERRDNAKDAKTAKAAAALVGGSLPVGVVPVSVWNAAADGNDNAAAAVADAKAAAKDAAARRAAKTATTAAKTATK